MVRPIGRGPWAATLDSGADHIWMATRRPCVSGSISCVFSTPDRIVGSRDRKIVRSRWVESRVTSRSAHESATPPPPSPKPEAGIRQSIHPSRTLYIYASILRRRQAAGRLPAARAAPRRLGLPGRPRLRCPSRHRRRRRRAVWGRGGEGCVGAEEERAAPVHASCAYLARAAGVGKRGTDVACACVHVHVQHVHVHAWMRACARACLREVEDGGVDEHLVRVGVAVQSARQPRRRPDRRPLRRRHGGGGGGAVKWRSSPPHDHVGAWQGTGRQGAGRVKGRVTGRVTG